METHTYKCVDETIHIHVITRACITRRAFYSCASLLQSDSNASLHLSSPCSVLLLALQSWQQQAHSSHLMLRYCHHRTSCSRNCLTSAGRKASGHAKKSVYEFDWLEKDLGASCWLHRVSCEYKAHEGQPFKFICTLVYTEHAHVTSLSDYLMSILEIHMPQHTQKMLAASDTAANYTQAQ